MTSFQSKSKEYGSIEIQEEDRIENDFESGTLTSSKIGQNINSEENSKYIGIILTIIGVSMILAVAAMSQTNGYQGSLTKMIQARGGSKGPIVGDTDIPPVSEIPDGGKAPSNTIPVLTKVTISTKRTFGLNRIGYSYIPTDNSPLSYVTLLPHTTIIEPYAESSLWISSPDVSLYYKYSVCNSEKKSICYDGIYSTSDEIKSTKVIVPCSPDEVYDLSYTSYKVGTENQVTTETGTGICKYVRREIRALSAIDLAKTMDAMYAMWTNNDEDGKVKYGSHFRSASYFTNLHHYNAAWQDSDHIHEGNGFLLQHMKMTNMYESSMQAVDPSVSLPYWDYTIDNAMGRSAFNSYIMQPDMFGSMIRPTDITYGFGPSADKVINAAIPNGRWAYLKAEKTSKYADLLHPYGYVRAPWNMNPSPYISRFTSDYRIGINLPSCTSHYNLLQKSDMMEFFYNSAFDSHATTHSMIGGIYGCELMKPLLEQGYINNEEDLKQICSKWVFNLKEFYRYNFIKPRTDCKVDEEDVNSAKCGFTCLDEGSTFLSNIKGKLGSHIPSDIGDDGLKAWSEFICRGNGYRIFAGDHLESASPADPSFWVIHPTLERLFQAKLMSGGFETSDWATNSKTSFVCEKARCFQSEGKNVRYADDCCYGHYETDQLFNAELNSRSEKIGLTNGEMIHIGNPTSTSYSLPYVYDSFAWTHCSQDFDSLFQTMSKYSISSGHPVFKIGEH